MDLYVNDLLQVDVVAILSCATKVRTKLCLMEARDIEPGTSGICIPGTAHHTADRRLPLPRTTFDEPCTQPSYSAMLH